MTAGHGMRGYEMRVWTDAEKRRLRELHAEGKLSQERMGKELGRTKNSVHRQLANMGLVINDRPPPKSNRGTRPKHAVERAGASTLPPLPSLQEDGP